jgi:hypothetical protein
MKHTMQRIEAGWYRYRGYALTHDAYGWRVTRDGAWIGDWHSTRKAARAWVDKTVDDE